MITHQSTRVKSIKAGRRMDKNSDNSDKYLWFFFLFFLWRQSSTTQTRMLDSAAGQQLSWIFGCALAPKQVFPFDGPYSSPPLCCAQLPGLSVVTASPFNAPDRGLFAPIYVFSPITPWQAGGCQSTLPRCWWSPLWLVLPASLHYIFHLFRFSKRGGLCHLSVLGAKCCLTPDKHQHHNAKLLFGEKGKCWTSILNFFFTVWTDLKEFWNSTISVCILFKEIIYPLCK